MRVSRIKYFAPWDWVIGASIPEEEMYETSAAIDRISSRGETILWVICLATLAVSCAIWYFLANGWTRRTGRIIRELNEASSEMSSAAAQVAATSQRLAEDANQQAASNDKVTSSLNQMGSVAQHNLDHSLALKQLATEARGAAEGGALQILAMKETMSQIQSAGGDVVKINKIIDEIAFQTNILALNAAVEAARAGAVGLGFAVVADEVRGLAHRCTEAARETSEKIEKSMNAGRRGAVVTSEVTNKLEVITANTQKLDKLAQSVALASEQQRKGIGEINAAAKQMNRGYNPRRPTPRKGPAGPMNSARRRAQSGVSPGSSVRCSGQTREFDRPLNPPLTEAVRCGKPGCPPWRGDG
jgi:methyl-accepting chemotaxis protein